ncbi:N-formylglutamate amidohydrolase [Hoeflea sp.]|uniref:N-formylglutamate amidohydrolase n=1 Tax=Hoeflea sp. TaxID=1940281 RepID=UPI002AFF830B|nr:N-formylglutamate amidohydrolase [Hoeflea sp.]
MFRLHLYESIQTAWSGKVSDLHDNTKAMVLSPGEPHPLEIFNQSATSDYFLICEHAGNRIPQSLGTMGLSETDRQRHIAWDIGARAVAIELSKLLDAPLYTQRYSRIVCDCNRRPDVAAFTPLRSEATDVPGNMNLTPEASEARAREIFWPFHNAVTEALDDRRQRGIPTKLVTVHSFTPVYLGQKRPWEIGVLFNRDPDLAPSVAAWLKDNTDLCIGINEPYAVGDDTDYAIPVHGEQRGLPCVEFEIRNDLIADASAAPHWAAILRDALVGSSRSD